MLPKLHLDEDYPCSLVGNWNTWYGEQDQAGEVPPSPAPLSPTQASPPTPKAKGPGATENQAGGHPPTYMLSQLGEKQGWVPGAP